MNKLHRVLLAPIVTEKVMNATARENSAGFWVLPSATKGEVKQAVEHFFKVSVTAVRTLNVRPKSVRSARGTGTQKAKKKAYVTLAQGHTISLTEA